MQSVTVTLSETYDLSTKIGRLGAIGIHTPGKNLIRAQWPGLWQNFRKIHLDSCRVVLACAALESVDPLQVGTSGDVIAPQDMFNPILYRPVSNDSFNIIVQRMKTLGGTQFPNGSIDSSSDPFASLGSGVPERIYYNLLADKSWRKAMPQQGLVMNGLYPIVYELVNSSGAGGAVISLGDADNTLVQNLPDVGNANYEPAVTASVGSTQYLSAATSARAPFTMRGASKRMPAIPIHNGVDDADTSNIPVSYCALIVTPPGKLKQMFFRLKVEWTISFVGLLPLSDYMKTGLIQNAPVYGSDYSIQSKDMDNVEGLADSIDADMTKVM